MATTATPKTTAAKTTVKRTPKPKATTTPKVEETPKTFRRNKSGFTRNQRVIAWHKRLMPVPAPATVTLAFSASDPHSTFVQLKWDGQESTERVHFTCVRPIDEPQAAPKAA